MKVLKLQIFHGNEMKEWRTIEDDVTKIGTLQSSHIQLEGLARMHAVIERSTDTFRLIDLGGVPPTFVNGEQIRQAEIQNGDMIHFGREGPWSMRATIETAVEVDVDRKPEAPDSLSRDELFETFANAAQRRKEREDKEDIPDDELFDHYYRKYQRRKAQEQEREKDSGQEKLFESLCEQMEELVEERSEDQKNDITRMLTQVKSLWKSKDPERKQDQIRRLEDIIQALKQDRQEKEQMAHALIDATSQIIAEGTMEEAFKISEEEALEKAADLVMEVSQYKDALGLLQVFSGPKEGGAGDKKVFLKGKHLLEKQLSGEVARKSLFLSLYIARAGGWTWEQQQKEMLKARRNLTEEELQVLENHPAVKKVFEAMERQSGS